LPSHQAPFIKEDGAAFLDEYPAGQVDPQRHLTKTYSQHAANILATGVA